MRTDLLTALALSATVASAAIAQDTIASARRTQVLGFTDFNYFATERRGVPEGFLEGQLTGHIISELTDRLTFFGEITASPRSTAFVVEVERTILRYDFSDALKLSAGRYHTPINYWNTAFHHGQWLQTTATRPQMIKFGGSFLPVHFVGVLAEGSAPGDIGLNYSLGLGNGRDSTISRAGDAGDANRNRSWVANVFLRPSALYGLQVGGSHYHDRISRTTGGDVREEIWAAHAVWWRETPEVMAEYARVGHEAVSASTGMKWSEGYYVQVAYRLPFANERLKPYARLEHVDVNSADVLLAPLKLGDHGATAGLRLELSPYAALKAEYRNELFEGIADRKKSLYVQLSLTFPAAEHSM